MEKLHNIKITTIFLKMRSLVDIIFNGIIFYIFILIWVIDPNIQNKNTILNQLKEIIIHIKENIIIKIPITILLFIFLYTIWSRPTKNNTIN